MKKQSIGGVLVLFVVLGALGLFVGGCELDNAGSVTREVGVDFTGLYAGVGESPLVSPENSGGPVTSLNLRQSGDQLQANDNYDIVFKGTIGAVQGGAAAFTLEGRTTSYEPVTISGTLSGQGDNAEMKGTWIEPGKYCNLHGKATIIQGSYTLTVNINPAGGGSVSPSGGSYSPGESVTLTATANAGYVFSSWSGATGSGATATVVMNGNKTVTANFTTGTNSSSGVTNGNNIIPPIPD